MMMGGGGPERGLFIVRATQVRPCFFLNVLTSFFIAVGEPPTQIRQIGPWGAEPETYEAQA